MLSCCSSQKHFTNPFPILIPIRIHQMTDQHHRRPGFQHLNKIVSVLLEFTPVISIITCSKVIRTAVFF